MEHMEKLCISAMEAARLLGISKSAVYELIRRGEIPALRLGIKRYVIPVEELQQLIKNKTLHGELTQRH